MAKVVALRQPRCCQPAIGSVHLDAFALMARYGNATPQFYILNSSFFIIKARRDETLDEDVVYPDTLVHRVHQAAEAQLHIVIG